MVIRYYNRRFKLLVEQTIFCCLTGKREIGMLKYTRVTNYTNWQHSMVKSSHWIVIVN